MQDTLREYFEGRERLQRDREREKRAALLLSEGLFEKVYAPEGAANPGEFPEVEYDPEKRESRYYKRVPLELTDGEYARVEQLAAARAEPPATSAVATALTWIACIVIFGGIFLGLFAGFTASGRDALSALITVLTYWGISIVSGVAFLGFAEIIKLLTAIRDK